MSTIDPQEYGALTARVAALERTVESMDRKIDHLVGLADRSRGALWAAMTLAGFTGGIVTWAVSKVLAP